MALIDVTANGNYPDDTGVSLTGDHVFRLQNPNGATVNLQVRIGDEWDTIPNGTFSAIITKLLHCGEGLTLRANVTGFVSAFSFEW